MQNKFKFNLSYLDQGGFYIKSDFFDMKDFNYIKENISKLEYIPKYQPHGSYYGNRFQAYPCYEAKNSDYFNNLFLNKFNQIFNRKPKDLECIIRKILTSELKMSKVNTGMGIVHSDTKSYATLMYFDQTTSGGTAFFENSWDKYPDITIGAYPNRLVAYNGRRPHAPMQDFSYEERYIIAHFFN
jgi:hypothetical protein